MKPLYVIALALSLGVGFAAPSQAQEDTSVTNGLIEKRGLTLSDFPRWKAVVPNVYAYEGTHPSGAINTVGLIIVTNDGVVLVDGQGDPKQGQDLVDNIKKLTPQPVKYLIVGSDHGDHINGNDALKAAWPDMVLISTTASQQAMAKSAVRPTEIVNDKRTLNVGGTEIEVLNLGRAHTGGDLSVYLPEHELLFMSEAYLRGVFPAMRTAYPSEWAETIKKAQAMNATWYIPGHGWIDDAAVLKAGLEDARLALEHVIAEGKRLHAAKVPCDFKPGVADSCQAAKQVNMGKFTDLALTDSQLPIAIAKIYQELEGKLP